MMPHEGALRARSCRNGLLAGLRSVCLFTHQTTTCLVLSLVGDLCADVRRRACAAAMMRSLLPGSRRRQLAAPPHRVLPIVRCGGPSRHEAGWTGRTVCCAPPRAVCVPCTYRTPLCCVLCNPTPLPSCAPEASFKATAGGGLAQGHSCTRKRLLNGRDARVRGRAGGAGHAPGACPCARRVSAQSKGCWRGSPSACPVLAGRVQRAGRQRRRLGRHRRRVEQRQPHVRQDGVAHVDHRLVATAEGSRHGR